MIGKFCKRCKTERPTSDFTKDLKSKDGLRPYCRSCSSALHRDWHDRNRERVNAYSRSYRAANGPRLRDKNPEFQRKTKYGLATEQYDQLFESQAGRCAICGQKPDRLCVDHCHTSKTVRGLLCTSCNLGLGHFKDSEASLLAAIQYLKGVQC